MNLTNIVIVEDYKGVNTPELKQTKSVVRELSEEAEDFSLVSCESCEQHVIVSREASFLKSMTKSSFFDRYKQQIDYIEGDNATMIVMYLHEWSVHNLGTFLKIAKNGKVIIFHNKYARKNIFCIESAEEFLSVYKKFKKNIKKEEELKVAYASSKDKDEKKDIQEKRKKLALKIEKARSFINHTLNDPNFYFYLALGRRYTIEYIDSDYLVVNAKEPSMKLLSNAEKADFLESLLKKVLKNQEDEKDLIDRIRPLLKPITISLKFKNLKTMVLYKELRESFGENIIKIDTDNSIDMTDIAPLAPVKPNIAASMIASGSGGKISKEVVIGGETIMIKSVMSRVADRNIVNINGINKTETTYTWKSQLGLFNKLRKEIEVLKD